MKKLWMAVLLVFLVGLTVPLSAKAEEEKIVLNWTDLYLYEGEKSFPLDYLKDSRMEWKSTDPSVATVTAKGRVYPKKEGMAVIVATLEGEEYYCRIRVGDKPYKEWENIVDEPQFSIYNGILFDYAGNNAEVVVPDGVHTIGEWAFRYCTETLEKVVLPDSVATIEEKAFEGCNKLKEVQFGQGLKEIGENAFYSCEELENISSLSCVETIGRMAFWCCYKLLDIGSLDSLQGIGANAFALTPWLETQQVANPMVICNGVLIDGSQCSGAVKIPDTVRVIAPEAFAYTNIDSVEIPDSVTAIGSGAFLSCYKVKSISMADSVREIGDYAFEQCYRLKNIRLSNSLQSIGERAFWHCKRLYNLALPGSLTELGDDLFRFCDGMQYVTVSPEIDKQLCEKLLYEIKENCPDTVKIYTAVGELNPEAKRLIEDSGFVLCDLKLLEEGDITIRKGDTFEQRLESYAKAKWTSSNPSVASVSKYGKITARKKGKAVITVSIYGREYSCNVTVK